MKEISPERKKLYTVGLILMAVGILLFLSVFVSAAMHFGDFSNFAERGRNQFLRAFIGMVLVGVGGVIRAIGSHGTAGSGLVLDPRKAKEDLEPWARMGGGLVKDALDEADVKISQSAQMPFDEKLRRLEALKEEGLISHAEYEVKRGEILTEKF